MTGTKRGFCASAEVLVENQLDVSDTRVDIAVNRRFGALPDTGSVRLNFEETRLLIRFTTDIEGREPLTSGVSREQRITLTAKRRGPTD